MTIMTSVHGDSRPLLRITDVAEQISMSPRAVYNLIAAGGLETINVGSTRRPRLRIRPAEVERFLSERTNARTA